MSELKWCIECRKPKINFPERKGRKSTRICVDCKTKLNEATKEKRNAARRIYRAKNKEKHYLEVREWQKRNPEKVKLYRQKTNKKYPINIKMSYINYRIRKKGATIEWADKEIIQLIYAEAVYRGMCVDHIIPLKGKTVCGLHIHNNMQLLPRILNSRKAASFNCIDGVLPHPSGGWVKPSSTETNIPY